MNSKQRPLESASECSFDNDVLQELSSNEHIDLEMIDISASHPLLVARSKSWDSARPTIFISAGMHGDEPSGVYAAVRFLNDELQRYTDRFNIVVMPCLNPVGFSTNTHLTPSNMNINGHLGKGNDDPLIRALEDKLQPMAHSIVFACDLHEDNSDERSGCYLYELLSEKRNRFAHRMLEAVEPKDIYTEPIVHMDNTEDNNNGVVEYDLQSNELDGTLSSYLKKLGAEHAVTIETPTTWPLEKRIESHLAMMRQGLASIKK